jgi:protein phosphatase
MQFAALSDRGPLRNKNEDRWYADPDWDLYAVADGIGGHAAGEIASELVMTVLPRRLKMALGDEPGPLCDALVEQAVKALSGVSREIHDESQNHDVLRNMGATVVLAIVRDMKALIVHLGDSRAYLLSGKHLKGLTKDHRLNRMLVDSGGLEVGEARRSPVTRRLTRYVGMPADAVPDATVIELHSNDRLLLCTDGLYEMLDDAQIGTILGRGESAAEACHGLINAALAAGGRDNITALVVFAPATPVLNAGA